MISRGNYLQYLPKTTKETREKPSSVEFKNQQQTEPTGARHESTIEPPPHCKRNIYSPVGKSLWLVKHVKSNESIGSH